MRNEFTEKLGLDRIVALSVQGKVLKKPLKELGFHLGKALPYIIAYILPPLFMITSFVLSYQLNWASWDWSLSGLARHLSGTALNLDQLRRTLAIASFTWVIPFNCLFTLGEEIGWRGFLYGQLKSTNTPWPTLMSNTIWGLWHAPLVAMGLNYPGYPLAGIIWMIVFTILMGWILCWLKDMGNSVFPPALAHATLNAQGKGLLPVLFPVANPLLGGPTGLVGLGILALIILFVWSLGRIGLRTPILSKEFS